MAVALRVLWTPPSSALNHCGPKERKNAVHGAPVSQGPVEKFVGANRWKAGGSPSYGDPAAPVKSSSRWRPLRDAPGGSEVERELDCGKIWTASRAVEGNTLRQVDTLGSGSCLVDFRPWSERPERSRARSRRHEAYNGGAEPLRWRDLGLGLGRLPPNWWREREKELKRRGQRCHCRPSLRDQTQRTHPQSMVLNNALNSQA
ncbi:hypothetical protein NDU88_007242 [Pleurodeles waltl]|uniref:Uncharacterized protein n=1 Tax=Pleurodeles waltl TaxID=8319 RepID=A0AAV7QP55_PLEWA|nr:hypothetical protein NDU88_007242 [Pleurodeles waltl]